MNLAPDSLTIERLFIEGVICLMRRHMQEGVEKLSQVCEHEKVDSPKNDFTEYVFKKVHNFVAYGLQCLGSFEKCKYHYQYQKQKFP